MHATADPAGIEIRYIFVYNMCPFGRSVYLHIFLLSYNCTDVSHVDFSVGYDLSQMSITIIF